MYRKTPGFRFADVRTACGYGGVQQVSEISMPARRIAVTTHRWLLFYVSLAVTGAAAIAQADTLFKCVSNESRTTYQQRPCDGGATSTLSTKGGERSGSEDATQSVKVPFPSQPPPVATVAPLVVSKSPAALLPASVPPQARGRLEGWPATGDGLVAGMSPSDVIKRWGRPTEWTCSTRTAFFSTIATFDWLSFTRERWPHGTLRCPKARRAHGHTNSASRGSTRPSAGVTSAKGNH